jgi:hypothetical protein
LDKKVFDILVKVKNQLPTQSEISERLASPARQSSVSQSIARLLASSRHLAPDDRAHIAEVVDALNESNAIAYGIDRGLYASYVSARDLPSP